MTLPKGSLQSVHILQLWHTAICLLLLTCIKLCYQIPRLLLFYCGIEEQHIGKIEMKQKNLNHPAHNESFRFTYCQSQTGYICIYMSQFLVLIVIIDYVT